jgi:hypothetical protein
LAGWCARHLKEMLRGYFWSGLHESFCYEMSFIFKRGCCKGAHVAFHKCESRCVMIFCWGFVPEKVDQCNWVCLKIVPFCLISFLQRLRRYNKRLAGTPSPGSLVTPQRNLKAVLRDPVTFTGCSGPPQVILVPLYFLYASLRNRKTTSRKIMPVQIYFFIHIGPNCTYEKPCNR